MTSKARVLRLAATGLLAPLVLAATPPSATTSAATTTALIEGATRVEQLPLDFLEANLPRTAADLGMDYAPRLVLVDTPTRADRNRLASSGLDVTEHAGHDYIEVVITEAAQETFIRDVLGLTYTVSTPDMITQEYERIMADAAYAQATNVSPLPSGRDTYRVLQDFYDELDQLSSDNPELAKRITVGESVEGRELAGIEIGVGVNEPEDGRPVFLMFGNHHAREWPSATTPMEFAHDAINSFNAGDERAIDLLSRARLIIVPVSNPDGYDASRTSGDLLDLNTLDGGGTASIAATPGNAYKRKNCRVVDGQTQPAGTCVLYSSNLGAGIGVDLNRNYGALWGGPGANGQTPNAYDNTGAVDIYGPTAGASPLYRGPAPFSEPETQAIRTLISTRQVTTLISNHTFSNLLLRPVGIQPSTLHPDGFPIGFSVDECFTRPDGVDDGMQALGARMTAQTGYSNQFGWELYDTTGTTEDYSYNATGGYGYTFEIGPDQFHPPFEEIVNEYLGTTAQADAVDEDNFIDLTTGTAQFCPTASAAPETFGGGLQEAYWLALENAANAQTHSVLTGTAPAGAEIKVERSGTFPLWDQSEVADTVSTTMVVGETGAFEYHVNPSTRPFVDSRPYHLGGPEFGADVTIVSQEDRASAAPLPPGSGTEDIIITVPEGIDSLVVHVVADEGIDDYDIVLFDPQLVELDNSGGNNTTETVQYQQPGGILPGDYLLRVANQQALSGFRTSIAMGTFAEGDDDTDSNLLYTLAEPEQWTVTCSVGGEVVNTREVFVARGDAKNLGDVCLTGASVPVPAPTPAPAPAPLPATGGGAVLAGLLAVGGALRLRRS